MSVKKEVKRVNYDCATGDLISFENIVYEVIDTYPNVIRASAKGEDVEVFSYSALYAARAVYVR
jgi:hypothetical protein